MTAAYSYLRLSTPEQIKGDSIRRQLERSRAYAERHGLQLDEDLRDLGVSAYEGRNREHGALGRFLEHVKSNRISRGSYLIVESLDRLSREKPRQALKPFLSLIDAGVKIVTLPDEQVYDENRLDKEPWGLLVSLTVMMRAHEESKLKSERVGAAWKRKHDCAGAIKVTARCPGWLQLSSDRKTFEVIPEKARAVRLAFESTAKGIGRQKTAAMLNAKGIPSPGGTRWYAASISRLLKSDAVLGVYQPHEVRSGKRVARGEPLPNYYPAIVKRDLVARARAAMAEGLLQDERGSQAGRKGRTYSNLFGGIAFCNECNSPMRLRNRGSKRGDPFLVCSTRLESAGESEQGRCQHRQHYQISSFERDLLQFLEEIDLSIFDDSRKNLLEKLADEVASVELNLLARQNELQRWMDAFGQEGVDAAQARIRNLDKEVRGLAHQLPRLKERLAHEQTIAMTAQEHVVTIGRLRKRMRRAEVDDRYAIRAQLAQEIRRVVETIWFGHPKFECIVYVNASSKTNLRPAYFLRRVRIGRRVAWECLRVPTQDNMNGMRLVHCEARRVAE
jgi:DNA invertase Pin-like site-specific DNA recombinase